MGSNAAFEAKIAELLAQARPYLESDGIDVELERISEYVIYVAVKGTPKGCMTTLMTIRLGLERRLMEEFPEIRGVVLV